MENCESIRKLILLELDGMCTPEEQARIQAHLAHCPECASYQKEMQQLTADLQQWGEDVPPLPEDFTQQVMARIRAQEKAPTKKIIPLRRWLVLGASAAALALVFLTVNGEILSKDSSRGLTVPNTATFDVGQSTANARRGDTAEPESNPSISERMPENGTTETAPQTDAQADAASAPVSEVSPETESAQPPAPTSKASASVAPVSPSNQSSSISPKAQQPNDAGESASATENSDPQPAQQETSDINMLPSAPNQATNDNTTTGEDSVASAATLETQADTADPANITGWVQLTPVEGGEEVLKQQLSTFSTQEDGYLIDHEQWPEVRQWCEEHQVNIQLEGTEEGDILATVIEPSEIILPEPALSTP